MSRKRFQSWLALAGVLLGSATAVAEPLGRLFFTPERRATLERQRQLGIQETRQVIEGATLTVSGVVRRSSGKATAWINNTPRDERNAAGGVRVEIDRDNPARATVIAGGESPATLKVGEAINRVTRETTSGISEGGITVRRESAISR